MRPKDHLKHRQDRRANKNRRQETRITKHFLLTYYDLLDPNVRYAASQLKNISLGGMLLITDRQMKLGTVLGIEVKTPFFLELTHFEGEVLESVERIKNIIYETRVKFYKLSPQAEFVLSKIIQHYVNKEIE